MPELPRTRYCYEPGCKRLINWKYAYCPQHLKDRQKEYSAKYEVNRETATQRGYNSRWAKIRKVKLNTDSQCERCNKYIKDQMLVHHKDRNPKNNRWENLMTLCGECHTAIHKEEGWRKK